MYKINLNCKPGKFYGTFVAIYSVLNVVAFIILLATTKWEVLMDDEADGFWIGFLFMVLGIVYAALWGIGPALVLRKQKYHRWMIAFPLAVFLILCLFFAMPTFTLIILCFPLSSPFYNCFFYSNVDLLLNLLTPVITPLIYASVLYLSIFISREKENPTI